MSITEDGKVTVEMGPLDVPEGMRNLPTAQEFFGPGGLGEDFIPGILELLEQYEQGQLDAYRLGERADGIEPAEIPEEYRATLQENTARHVINVTETCVDNWESGHCHATLLASNRAMAGDLSARLFAETYFGDMTAALSQCAAASTRPIPDITQEFLGNAFAQCANEIDAIERRTGVAPNPDLFGILFHTAAAFQQNDRARLDLMNNHLPIVADVTKAVLGLPLQNTPAANITVIEQPQYTQNITSFLQESCPENMEQPEIINCVTAHRNAIHRISQDFHTWLGEQDGIESEAGLAQHRLDIDCHQPAASMQSSYPSLKAYFLAAKEVMTGCVSAIEKAGTTSRSSFQPQIVSQIKGWANNLLR